MASSISGTSSIYGVNGISSINSIYGINSYRSYLASISNHQNNSLASIMNTTVANSLGTNNTQLTTSSYLALLNQSIYSTTLTRSTYSLSNKIAASSDSTAISATANWNASVKSYSIKVSNLAAAQTNVGSTFAADDKSIIDIGLNTFKIKSGSVERNLSVSISSTDSNKSAFVKFATAVNKSDAGVKANVVTDSNNKITIFLESNKTGTKSAFSLTDLEGDAISSTSLGTIMRKAQDAAYSVNGRQYTSSSNTITLDNGKIQATLKKSGDTEVSLSVVPDTGNNSLPDFYTYYNNILSSGNYYSGLISGTLLNKYL